MIGHCYGRFAVCLRQNTVTHVLFEGRFMPNPKVLLIEHEASLRDVLDACLRELGGWDVTSSKSIQEGILLCERHHPDVILVDASAPEADALLFIEQLKMYSKNREIPIVLMSARASWFTGAELRQMGFLGAISKPFNPSTLSAQIHRLVASPTSSCGQRQPSGVDPST